MSASATQIARVRTARMSGRNLLAEVLHLIAWATLICVPIVWGFMPWILRFNPIPYVIGLVACSAALFVAGLVARPRILRPDFVNSIMLYQEDHS